MALLSNQRTWPVKNGQRESGAALAGEFQIHYYHATALGILLR